MLRAPLQGTYLLEDLAWLESHARPDTDGFYRCSVTREHINSRMLHRCCAEPVGPDSVFVEDHLWAVDVRGVVSGRLVTFSTLWCTGCEKEGPHKHSSVQGHELTCVGSEAGTGDGS